MKKCVLKFVFAVLVLSPFCAKATNMAFTGSGTITDGDIYADVGVQNSGTVVNMSGGQITNILGVFSGGTFNMSGGLISGYSVDVGSSGTFNITTGTIDAFDFVVEGSASFYGGNITAYRLKTYPASSIATASVVNINGGNINFDMFDIHGVVNIYRGLLYVNDAWIGGWGNDQPVVNIYGSNFNYNTQTKILTGYLLDSNPFTIKGVDASEYARFNLIPEPMSILFFGFGLLALRKSKK